MEISFIDEPELEFGNQGHNVDIRQGLELYGALDARTEQRKTIRLGIVGTAQTIDGISGWLEKCRSVIPAKSSNQPNLFPLFPGSEADKPFNADFIVDETLCAALSPRDVAKAAKESNYRAICDAKDLLMEQVAAVVEKGRADTVILSIPNELILVDHDEEDELTSEFEKEEQEYETHIDLRDLLKAEAMKLGRPIQLVIPTTYDEKAKRRLKTRNEMVRKVQDEATRAWNFHVALYYKAGGVPWRLVRDSKELATCYVGISFYKSLEANSLLTSLAQVYDERGEGVIVRGASVTIDKSKGDLQPHLAPEDAYDLLKKAVDKYRQEHKHFPARMVLHKSSSYSSGELDGFNRAIDDQRIEVADFLVISKSLTRLYRNGDYPPLRGTMLSLDNNTHLLYTKGSVDHYSTYPGMYIPRPLKIACAQAYSSPGKLASEIMALTKLNWNNTQFDGGEPITMRVARQVGKVLKYVPDSGVVQPRYSFYM